MTLLVGGGMLLWIEHLGRLEDPGDLPPPPRTCGPAARDPVVAALASLLMSASGTAPGDGGDASGRGV